MIDTVKFNGKLYNATHGSPFDRGGADSYYSRPRCPHYWPDGTGHGVMVDAKDMTFDQIDEYNAGYAWNEENGDKKDWG